MNATKPAKLMYDAQFSGPRGSLNPMGLKVPGLIAVQIYPTSPGRWTIKNPDTNSPLTKSTFQSPSLAMDHLPELFTKQETDWTIRNMDGTPHIVRDEPVEE